MNVPSEQPEKAVKRSVSFNPAILAAAQSAAEEQFGGNLSKLVNELLSGATSGRAVTPLVSPTDRDCLLKLCERFCPTYMDEMRIRCGLEGEGAVPIDQPKMLEIVLKLFATGQMGLRDVWMQEQYPMVAESPKEYGKRGQK